MSSSIIGHKSLAAFDINTLFPLYYYPDLQQKNTLINVEEPSHALASRRPNFAQVFLETTTNMLQIQFVSDGKGDLQQNFGPEDIFNYMYAIFHSPTYRTRYAEFLKVDFPRLPLTSNVELFRELCILGDRLVKLHLMEAVATSLPSYPAKGDNLVDIARYTEPGQGWEQGRVWINKAQYFEGVSPEIWSFFVGGYQVCHKWLKDRKGRTLSYEDIEHYQQVVAALDETNRLMQQIDDVIDTHGGWPIM